MRNRESVVMKYDMQMATPDCGHIFEVTHAWVA